MPTHKTPRHTRHPFQFKKSSLYLALGAIAVCAGAVFYVPHEWRASVASALTATTEQGVVQNQKPKAEHVAPPEPLKGIYMSQCVVGTPSFREKLVKLIDDTELNAVIIDIKDYTGKIAFTTDNPALADSVSDACGARDMRSFVQMLHEKGIYVIGRITVFQDPYYTGKHPESAVKSASTGGAWKDYKGLAFIDVSHRPYWDYVVELSREAYEVFGFDELNYDYIRYPSDGPMKDAVYVNQNKPEAVELFWKYLAEKVKPIGVTMSADLFGMTATNTDDLNIGQQLERALPHFDYVMPMVYPSHYPKGFNNLGNPNMHPYEIVQFSMAEAARRATATQTVVKTLGGTAIASTSPQLYTKPSFSPLKLRTWLQDFDYGKEYTVADIKAQIQGTYDAGLTSWIFWDPANRYDSLKAALAEEGTL
ncbi:putative glycoside hydrolase [Patescibacteria group bacterium]|nr:putative glycoside hydrolase [Patescibacteria group bacterium]